MKDVVGGKLYFFFLRKYNNCYEKKKKDNLQIGAVVIEVIWWRDLAKRKSLVRSSTRDGQKFPQHKYLPEQQRQTHQKLRACFSVCSRCDFHPLCQSQHSLVRRCQGTKFARVQKDSEKLFKQLPCAPTSASLGNAQEREAQMNNAGTWSCSWSGWNANVNDCK